MFTRSSGTFRAGNAEAETVETVWTRSNVLEASVSHNKKEWSDYWTLMKVKPLLFYFEHNFQGENCRKTTLLNKEFLVFWSNVFLTWATMQKKLVWSWVSVVIPESKKKNYFQVWVQCSCTWLFVYMWPCSGLVNCQESSQSLVVVFRISSDNPEKD